MKSSRQPLFGVFAGPADVARSKGRVPDLDTTLDMKNTWPCRCQQQIVYRHLSAEYVLLLEFAVSDINDEYAVAFDSHLGLLWIFRVLRPHRSPGSFDKVPAGSCGTT